jgi:hypothetical protein
VQPHDPECIHDHVFPHLDDPRRTEDGGYRALAPCHPDTERSLSISVGANGRVVWCCHACRRRLGTKLMLKRTRHALIDAGVPDLCLLRPADEARDLEAEISAIIFGKGSRTWGWLEIAAKLRGYGGLPHGDELVALASDCGVSRRAAFDALRESGDDPTTGTGHDDQEVVKPRRSA